ncbi:transposase [Paracoccus sp. (in: a-proteobacteria)]|uniref:transposase n=1 Tax=Paracoccus sp. TaxID=267 RepID=UPI00322053C3
MLPPAAPVARYLWSHSPERAQIAVDSMMPGVTVADVARQHGVTRWQVYDWRP